MDEHKVTFTAKEQKTNWKARYEVEAANCNYFQTELKKAQNQITAQQQRITELEAQLNTRNAALERDGDPLREKFQELLDEYGNRKMDVGYCRLEAERIAECQANKAREELDARLSTLVDTVRVLVRDNKAQQADLQRYKTALEAILKVSTDKADNWTDVFILAEAALNPGADWSVIEAVAKGGGE